MRVVRVARTLERFSNRRKNGQTPNEQDVFLYVFCPKNRKGAGRKGAGRPQPAPFRSVGKVSISVSTKNSN